MALLPSSSRSSSSSSSSSKRGKYDVFLSFRGEDTRKKFTDHLYRALEQKGISTFRDDEKLKRGTSIAPELLKAIEESRFAVIILSRDYASSKWCLIELTKIVECMEKTGLVVLPVFHYVDPSDVRNHRGTFAEAFDKHQESFKDNMRNIETWKAALTKVADLAGWDLKDKYESKVIQEIIGRICPELYHKFSSAYEDHVGIDSRVEEMLGSYLGEGLGDVRFVGICGMGGMGKTTLAHEIFSRISVNFEGSCIIANIREETKNQGGLVSLQKQLLSKILMESEMKIWNVYEGLNVIRNTLHNKKVFIVLDDVDGEEQLEALAGKRDWFGSGSRIIVTSRDSHLLIRCGVNDIYTTEGLSDNDALKLFSLKAFHKPHPEENFVTLSKVFVKYAKGLPLALKVLGSLLFGKTKNEWKSALNRLKAEFEEKIMNILQISFDGLRDTQKALFLDIACFFKGKNKDCIRDVLQSFGYYPDCNIDVLIDKSLITIEGHGILWMHDLLQDMGQEIVRRKSPREPGGRSRLWIYKDVIHVLKNNTGTEAVEGIMLKVPIQKMEHLHAEAFSKMKNLRFLKIGNEEFSQDIINGTMQLPKSLNYLSDELRIVEWHGYPFKSMPTSFQPNKLVELRMRWSCIKHLWKGIMDLDELRLIDLSDSQNLIEMPDLSRAPKLKQLILQRCIRLSEIHASLGNLKWLTRLDLNGCKCLESLPSKINLESLEIFILSGCSKINELPENLGDIKGLEELDVSGTAITELPSSIVLLKNLKVLSLGGCEGLSSMSSNKLFSFTLMQKRRVDPTGMLKRTLSNLRSNLWSLTELNLSYCNLPAIPDNLGCLHSLSHLDLRGNAFVGLPKSTTRLSSLKSLYLSGCTHLRSLPELPLNIMDIYADGCTSLDTLPVRPDANFLPFMLLVNCIKLIDDNQDCPDICLAILRNYFQSQGKMSFPFAFPRREIPKWFTHQSVGASMNLQVPPSLCNKLKGVVVCAIFVLRQHHPFAQLNSFFDYRGYRGTHILRCSLKSDRFCFVGGGGFGFSEEFGEVESYHLFLDYQSIVQSFEERKEKLSQADVDIFRQIEIKYTSQGPGLEVMKCGGRLIFEQDIEDLNQTMPRCSNSSSCSITPYEDDFEGLAEDTKTKRSSDDYDGTSGEGRCTTPKKDNAP